ncbi:S-4TM family putative pore-forming effector [Micromonospora aurantiaca (nom. illeg.)]|uniref:S-4TM family putative pore-forming effector n=1 Tax=Micromonospora aurantiaca (nom. illeg.) TaxID=47850 RepID=UPI003EBAD35C
MTSTQHLRKTQNSASSLRLLRAVRVAHQNNQWAQGLSFLVSAALAAAGLLSRSEPTATATVALIGTTWAAFYWLLIAPWAERHLWTAAALQERFDTEVLGLPWNRIAVGDPISDDEVNRLARRFRGDADRLLDYYLIADAAAPYGVLFCLEQNLAWGSRVRFRFAQLAATFMILWSVFGVVLVLSTGGTVNQLLSGWFAPSLGLLIVCLDAYRVQIASSRERTRVLAMVRAAFDDPASPLITNATRFTTFARQVQDTLFTMRRVQPRLPHWYFKRFHHQDKSDFEVKRDTLEDRFPPFSLTVP